MTSTLRTSRIERLPSADHVAPEDVLQFVILEVAAFAGDDIDYGGDAVLPEFALVLLGGRVTAAGDLQMCLTRHLARVGRTDGGICADRPFALAATNAITQNPGHDPGRGWTRIRRAGHYIVRSTHIWSASV